MPTFADLGIDFPLFTAGVDEAEGWSPAGRCTICEEDRAGFEIGIGDYSNSPCGGCGAMTPQPADGREERCINCGANTRLGGSAERCHGCARCLRTGRWASTKDTEAGMVTPIHAAKGTTHGLPYLPGASAATAWEVPPNSSAADRVDLPDASPKLAGWPEDEPDANGWRRALIPAQVLEDLVRGPTYVSIQGDRWLFHCQSVMRYLGKWGKRQFAAASSDGARLAAEVADVHLEAWEHLGDEASSSSIWVYMFECASCGELRGHWDMD